MRLEPLAKAHIAYWGVTGVWPLIDMRSFESVTGPKRDDWLVRTVSLLILSVVTGLVALLARRRDDTALRVLGGTSAAALGAVSLAGPLSGRISKIYLVDAVVELALALSWLRAEERA